MPCRRPSSRGRTAAPSSSGPSGRAVLLVPPDVVAAWVDQLELELVGWRHPMDVEGEGISFRQWEREALARDDEASAAFEIEVEPQGAAAGPSVRGNVELRLSRSHRGPAGEVGEVVENLALHGCGGRPSVARSRAAHRWSAVRSDSPGDENRRSHVRTRSATDSTSPGNSLYGAISSGALTSPLGAFDGSASTRPSGPWSSASSRGSRDRRRWRCSCSP